MASTSSGSPVTKIMIKLLYAGKRLLLLPSSSAELLNVLAQMEQILSKVQQSPSESINNALHPIIEAIFAKELVRHPDMNVNISVACCVCEIMRIIAPEKPYSNEQMKDFFEMVIITFENLSGGCYTKMNKVLNIFSNIRLVVLMLDLELAGHGLIVRLFKQFLTVADSNSSAIVHEMEKIMTMIIEESEELAFELLGLIVTYLKKDNQIASPVCWQLGEKVLMNCAAKLKPHLPNMGQHMSIALYDYSKMVSHICNNASENEIMVAKESIPYTTHKIKLECPETLRSCQDASRHTVDLLDIHFKHRKKHEKKSHTFSDDPTKYLTEAKGKRKRNNSPWKKQAQSVEDGENLVGSRIKVWWPEDKMYYPGVIKFFDRRNKRHKVLYDDGDEELLNLKRERWMLFETVAAIPDTLGQALPRYKVKQSVAPILEAIFKKHGDIAAKCVFKTHSVRASFLEIVCEVVKQMETNEIIEKMEEIESQVSDVEAAKINVSWLRAHLEAIHKRKEF